MTYYCTNCSIYWAPYQCRESRCPHCLGGLGRSQEPMTRGAVEMYAAARSRNLVLHAQEAARAALEILHERFENYYLKREQDHDAALPHEQDDLEDQARMPTREHP